MSTDTQPVGGKSRDSVRLLVAEDSPVNLQLALVQLQNLGYQPDAAANGREALERIQNQPYDIILMDCQMPEMDGYEATWQIRHQEQERAGKVEDFKPVYIIAMTADTSADSREKCLAAGMNDYMRKPVQLAELEAALERALRGTGQSQEEVLDPMVLAGLRLLRQPNKPDPVAQLIQLFLKEAPERLAAVEKAIESNDMWSMSKIVAAVTSLRGSASSLGARQLATVCGQIEEAARSGSLDEAGQQLQEARVEFERARQALEQVK